MFFATTSPAGLNRHLYSPAGRSLARFLAQAQTQTQQKQCFAEQDETSFTLKFDVPGVTKEQLSIGIEGNTVRIESREGAARQYQAAYELPQDIDLSSSDAKLAHGVLTLKLGKLVPVSRATELVIN